MQLQPGERSILAYFSSDTNASQAVQALKMKGFNQVQTDPISRNSRRQVNPTFPSSLSSLVMGGGEYGRAYGPLLAADPLASGMSANNESSPGYSHLVTLITEADRYPEAVQIIKEYGGTI